MGDVVGFKQETAGRIMRVVQANETKGPDLVTRATGNRPAIAGFWAELTSSYDATTGYAWKRLKPSSDGKGLQDCSPSVTGGRLFEATGDTTLTSGKRVWVTPNGIDGGGNACFVCAPGGGGGSVGMLVKITGTESASGLYKGRSSVLIQSSGSTPVATWSDYDDCLVQNYLGDVHDLAANGTCIVPVVVLGMTTEATPRKICGIWAFAAGC